MIYRLESEQITCEIFSKAGLSINSINDMVTEIQNGSKFRMGKQHFINDCKGTEKSKSPVVTQTSYMYCW